MEIQYGIHVGIIQFRGIANTVIGELMLLLRLLQKIIDRFDRWSDGNHRPWYLKSNGNWKNAARKWLMLFLLFNFFKEFLHYFAKWSEQSGWNIQDCNLGVESYKRFCFWIVRRSGTTLFGWNASEWGKARNCTAIYGTSLVSAAGGHCVVAAANWLDSVSRSAAQVHLLRVLLYWWRLHCPRPTAASFMADRKYN